MAISKSLEIRRGSFSNMESSSIVLKEGEVFFEYPDDYMGGVIYNS